jgi:hypothetical protein
MRIDERANCCPCHTRPVNVQANAIRATLAALLSPVLLFAQDAKTVGIVAPNLVEFRIPLEQPAGATWKWNRTETPDNGGEYTWQVSIPGSGGRYSFGFYLYKLPGSKPAHGDLQSLFKDGQTSVFREDAGGRTGTEIQNAAVEVSTEDDSIVIRITDAKLIHTIFGDHPETATINTRAMGANFEVVKIEYRN